MKNETSCQALYLPMGIAAFFLIGGMALGGVLGSGTAWSFFKPPLRLAVVDMQALIAKGSQHLAKTSPNKALGKTSKVSSHQIWQAGEQLKETLEAFATKHHLILLAKGAVMGGNLPDYTEEVMEEAFPDYTAGLLTFIENKTASQQSKSDQHESHRLKSQRLKSLRSEGLGLQPKGQGHGNQGHGDQESQP
jgi:hypothetical protein